jgi:hypothetical protein
MIVEGNPFTSVNIRAGSDPKEANQAKPLAPALGLFVPYPVRGFSLSTSVDSR